MNSSIHHLLIATAIGLFSVGAGTVAYAQQGMKAADHQGMRMAAQDAMNEGEIKKFDKEAGKVTIKHGELKNIGMPAMTMTFTVKDRAMLSKVKEGDKVHFAVEKISNAYTVTAIEVKK